jgi:ribulose-bisphosphate carboxylase large chain
MADSSHILATYLVETPLPLQRVIEVIAGEQSSGTFVAVPGETPELQRRHRAQIEDVELVTSTSQASLRGAKTSNTDYGEPSYQRAKFTLSFPFENIGSNLPQLLATVCGNLYELSDHSGLKLLDLQLPSAFNERYSGPQFGIEGTRRFAGVRERPIIGTIVKPSVGLTPDATAELVRELGEAGIDFIKDDELIADAPYSPLKERVEKVMRVINELADKTGKKVMFAFNISDETDAMLRHHDTVLQAGGTCVMVSLNHVGVSGVSHLRRHCQLPIHGHRNGWGMLTRHPLLGIEFAAYQKIWRIAGVDHLHVNGLQNKFWESDESVVTSIENCLTPLWEDKAWTAMPVVSSGQWGGQAPETYRRTRTVDLMYVAGGGIMAHPQGPAAGLRGLQQAWEAAVQYIPLEEYAQTHPELQGTLEKFGKK